MNSDLDIMKECEEEKVQQNTEELCSNEFEKAVDVTKWEGIVGKISDVELYLNIVRDVRDMKVLSSYQIHYLRGISNDKLIRLIEIYNLVINNVNELL